MVRQVPAALMWPQAGLPKALSVRVREAGWLWSGAIPLDAPGDQFCKIRHRYSIGAAAANNAAASGVPDTYVFLLGQSGGC